MHKSVAYYPQSEGITYSKPSMCYCGHDDFKILSDKDKNQTRYLCKGCKKSYFVKDSDTVRQQLSRIGNVLDNVILGMSSRQTCLKMFIDQGLMIKHPTILKWSNKSVQYVKMFTDDILCCLAYGRTWGALVNFGDLITKICQSHLGGSRTQGRLQDHHLRAGKLIAWPSDVVC